eukprot:g2858.t1
MEQVIFGFCAGIKCAARKDVVPTLLLLVDLVEYTYHPAPVSHVVTLGLDQDTFASVRSIMMETKRLAAANAAYFANKTAGFWRWLLPNIEKWHPKKNIMIHSMYGTGAERDKRSPLSVLFLSCREVMQGKPTLIGKPDSAVTAAWNSYSLGTKKSYTDMARLCTMLLHAYDNTIRTEIRQLLINGMQVGHADALHITTFFEYVLPRLVSLMPKLKRRNKAEVVEALRDMLQICELTGAIHYAAAFADTLADLETLEVSCPDYVNFMVNHANTLLESLFIEHTHALYEEACDDNSGGRTAKTMQARVMQLPALLQAKGFHKLQDTTKARGSVFEEAIALGDADAVRRATVVTVLRDWVTRVLRGAPLTLPDKPELCELITDRIILIDLGPVPAAPAAPAARVPGFEVAPVASGKGFAVSSIVGASAAAVAGLVLHDLVVAVGGRPVLGTTVTHQQLRTRLQDIARKCRYLEVRVRSHAQWHNAANVAKLASPTFDALKPTSTAYTVSLGCGMPQQPGLQLSAGRSGIVVFEGIVPAGAAPQPRLELLKATDMRRGDILVKVGGVDLPQPFTDVQALARITQVLTQNPLRNTVLTFLSQDPRAVRGGAKKGRGATPNMVASSSVGSYSTARLLTKGRFNETWRTKMTESRSAWHHKEATQEVKDAIRLHYLYDLPTRMNRSDCAGLDVRLIKAAIDTLKNDPAVDAEREAREVAVRELLGKLVTVPTALGDAEPAGFVASFAAAFGYTVAQVQQWKTEMTAGL